MRDLVFAGLFLALLPGLSAGPATPGWLNRAWQVDDGLPDNQVNGVVQTPDGYLWVGTLTGLARFDGTRFQEFPLRQVADIPSPLVRNMMMDHTGRLWLLMDRGFLVCITSDEIQVYDQKRGLPNQTPRTIAEDEHGTLWLVYGAHNIFQIQNDQIRQFVPGDAMSAASPYLLGNDREGRLWLAGDRWLGRFRDNQFSKTAELPEPATVLGAAQAGGIWICTTNRLMKCEPDGRIKEIMRLPAVREGEPVKVQCLLEDRTGLLWMGTANDGLFRFDGSEFVSVDTSSKEITSLAEDREGDVWVGTANGGLNRLRPRILELQGTAKGLPYESVRSVAEDASGTVWVTTGNGILATLRDGRWTNRSSATNWPGGSATCVTADRQGAVWIGTENAGLVCWKDGNYQIRSRKEGLMGNGVRALLAATNESLWIVTLSPNGFQRLRDGQLQNFEISKSTRSIRAMAEDAAGTLWLGTSWGDLLRMDGNRVVLDPATEKGQHSSIRCLLATPDGSLWIGYAGGGLGWLKDGHYCLITKDQGLADDHISQMISDDQNRLWLVANHGFFEINLAELVDLAEGRRDRVNSLEYGLGEGLPNLEASLDYYPGAIRGKAGRLLFAMRRGVAVIHTKNIERDSEPPPVLIEGVAVDDQPAALYDRRFAGQKFMTNTMDLRHPHISLSLKPDHHKVEFDFTALSFPAPENVRFRYRLDGFDQDWIDAGTQRSITYSRLPAGDYNFRVIACNNVGIWNLKGTAFNFTVDPFFWQTWWFRTGVILLFTGLVGVTVRYWAVRRLRLRLEKFERQAALEKERARIARDLHDDLGANLTQVGLMLEEAREQTVSTEDMKAHSRQLSSRIHNLARDLDVVVWAVNPRNDTLTKLVAYLSQFFLESFRPTGIRPRLKVADEIPDRPISAEARHHLFLIAKEAIHNVIKHSRATEVHLEMAVVQDAYEFKLEDNGCGFVLPALPDSPRQGLRNLKVRVEAVAGQIEIQSRPGKGTAIRITVPLHGNRKLD